MRRECRLSLLIAVLLLAAGAIRAAEPADPEKQGSPQISFTGKVLDSRGKPVSDANVILYEVNYESPAGSPR